MQTRMHVSLESLQLNSHVDVRIISRYRLLVSSNQVIGVNKVINWLAFGLID